ncbi:hypothetical protein M8J77_017958 [Diaphorina citri]|nr:hypothetical protein M8J77_017958 [Diaphorina citri]
MRIKFHTSAGIEPTPSCLPGERLDHYTTEAGGVVVNNEHKNRKARVEYENKTKEMPLFTEFGSIKRAFGSDSPAGHALAASPVREYAEPVSRKPVRIRSCNRWPGVFYWNISITKS